MIPVQLENLPLAVAAWLRGSAIVLIVALWGPFPAQAQDYQYGLAAAKRGDYVVALREWRRLAENGDAKAQYNLGFMYAKGIGVRRDYGKAINWLFKAAEQGHGSSQKSLGVMYARGVGVPKDYVLAYMWLNIAAARGTKGAKKNLNLAAKRMTLAQIAEAQKLARTWWANHPEK